MQLTSGEIRDLINIARDNPSMAPEDIINAIVEGYSLRIGIRALLSNIGSVLSDKPIGLRPEPAEILEVVCKFHGFKPDQIKSKSRIARIVRVRQQYCLIAILFRHSQETTAMEINRDHCTALWNKNKALKFYENEPEYKYEIEKIISKIPNHERRLIDRLDAMIKKITQDELKKLIQQNKKSKNICKLSEFQVEIIRKCEGLTQKELGKIFKVNQSTISEIINFNKYGI